MTGTSCEVTVVIPTKNRAAFLRGALRSALSQVDVSFEVSVVDDASSDGTAELLRACSDTRVKPVRHASSRGVSAARNRGVSEAKGEWLAFLDDDDLWSPTWLRTALEVARMENAGVVYGSRYVVDEHRRVIGVWPAAHARTVHASLATSNALGGPSGVMVRADVMATAGGFDERLSVCEDWEAWLRILDICRAAPVPEFLVAYTMHSDNVFVRDPFGYLAQFDVFVRVVKGREGAIRNVDEARFVRSLAADVRDAGRRGAAARLWLRSARISRSPGSVVRAGLALTRAETGRRAFAAPGWLLEFVPQTTDARVPV